MVEIPDDVARSMGRALRGQDTLDLKVALEYADLLDPPKPPPTLVKQMVDAFYGTRGDRMTAALAVVRAAVEELTGRTSLNFESGRLVPLNDVLDLLSGESGE